MPLEDLKLVSDKLTSQLMLIKAANKKDDNILSLI